MNHELLLCLDRIMEKDDVSLAKLIKYFCRWSDMDYIINEELLGIAKNYEEFNQDINKDKYLFFKPLKEEQLSRSHELTAKQEEIGYQRFLEKNQYEVGFDVSTTGNMYDFIRKFVLEFGEWEEYEYLKEYELINHCTHLHSINPFRYVQRYYIDSQGISCKDTNSFKIPDYPEMLTNFLEDGFHLVFDCEDGDVRVDEYPELVQFGMEVSGKKVEIYDPYHAVLRFHELFVKCEKIIDCIGQVYNKDEYEGSDYLDD